MEHLFTHLFQGLLKLLGMDQKQQVYWVILAYLAAFVVWALRSRRHGRVFSWLFAVMGLSLTVVLFSESRPARWVAFAVFTITTVAAFTWHAVRARRSGVS